MRLYGRSLAMRFRQRERLGQWQRGQKHKNRFHLLRCIIGNPFYPILLDPAWLTWQNGTIPKLAQAIYEERMFDCLPILADALEEVGCSDPDLLGHLRGPEPHVRGCWVVDLILGRE